MMHLKTDNRKRFEHRKPGRAAFAAALAVLLFLLAACGRKTDGNKEPGSPAENTVPAAELRTEPVAQVSAEDVLQQASLRIPDFEKKQMLQKLEPELLQDFVHLYTCTQQFEEKCVFPIPLSKEQTGLLMSLLHTECPELFQYNVAAEYGLELTEGEVLSVSVPYGMNRDIYEERMKYCRQRLDEFREKAFAYADPYEQEMLIYALMCELVEYDREYERAADASGALVEGRAKCDGISLAFKWMMDELGIPCIVITGDSRKTEENPLGHAWNLVKPGGQWRLVDVTQDTSGERAGESLMYPLYNVSEDWEAEAYEISEGLRSLGIPACTGMEESYHVKNGSYFTGTGAKEGFLATLERALSEGTGVPMQFETKEAWEDFLKNSDSWANEWMDEKGLFGRTFYASIDAYRVAQVGLEISGSSLPMKTLVDQINVRQFELEEEKKWLDTEAAELNRMHEELDALRTEAEAIAALDRSSLDEAAVNRYNCLVDQFNALLEEYSLRAESYEQRAGNFETAIEEYNAMIRSLGEMASQS